MQYDVFISYSRRDYLDENGDVISGNVISKIKEVLKNNGITYWIDEDGINSGDEFARLIIRSIKESKVLLFVSTENSNNSAWTRKEIASAIAYKKKIIPFKCDDTPFNDSLLLYLADLDFISYSKQGSRALSRLVTSIKNYLNSEVETKPEPKPEPVPEPKPEPKPVTKPEPKPEIKPEPKPELKPRREKPVAETPKGKSKTRNIVLITLISLVLVGAVVWLLMKSQKTDSIEEPTAQATEQKIEQKVEAKTEQKVEPKAEPKAAEPAKQESKPVKKDLKDMTVTVKGIDIEMVAVKGNGKVGDFLIGKYEVTQGLWKAVMGKSVQQQRDMLDPSFKLRGEGDNMPMYYVNWEDCQSFIKKLNSLTGKKFRLPTEAEWEYAAKGGVNGEKALSGWYEDNSNGSTHAVGGKEPNALGLYDMAGNVSEWCKDKKDYEHVVKGGGWASTKDKCKASSRSYLDEMIRTDETGLRLVLD